MNKNKLFLWQYNSTTGYWVNIRDVSPETAEQWLKVYRDDCPHGVFKVAKHRPTTNPKANEG